MSEPKSGQGASEPGSALWRLRGLAVISPELPTALVMQRLEAVLADQHKAITRPEPNVVGFQSSLLAPTGAFAANWLAMATCDRGRFWIEEKGDIRTLHYDLRLFELLVASSAFSGIAFLFQAATGDLATGAGTALFFFAVLYGVNRLLAWVRIPGRIEWCAQEPESTRP